MINIKDKHHYLFKDSENRIEAHLYVLEERLKELKQLETETVEVLQAAKEVDDKMTL